MGVSLYEFAVTALLKVENLKANHNAPYDTVGACEAVTALLKVENLKANHNTYTPVVCAFSAVTALLKVENLKANHNHFWGVFIKPIDFLHTIE